MSAFLNQIKSRLLKNQELLSAELRKPKIQRSKGKITQYQNRINTLKKWVKEFS